MFTLCSALLECFDPPSSSTGSKACIRFFKAECPWTIIKCLFSASCAYIQRLRPLNENVDIKDFWLFINPRVLFKGTKREKKKSNLVLN